MEAMASAWSALSGLGTESSVAQGEEAWTLLLGDDRHAVAEVYRQRGLWFSYEPMSGPGAEHRHTYAFSVPKPTSARRYPQGPALLTARGLVDLLHTDPMGRPVTSIRLTRVHIYNEDDPIGGGRYWQVRLDYTWSAVTQ